MAGAKGVSSFAESQNISFNFKDIFNIHFS